MKHHQQPSELTLVDFQVIGAVLGEAFPAMTGLWHEEARMIRLQFDSPTLVLQHRDLEAQRTAPRHYLRRRYVR
jgi:hypothetical protein